MASQITQDFLFKKSQNVQFSNYNALLGAETPQISHIYSEQILSSAIPLLSATSLASIDALPASFSSTADSTYSHVFLCKRIKLIKRAATNPVAYDIDTHVLTGSTNVDLNNFIISNTII